MMLWVLDDKKRTRCLSDNDDDEQTEYEYNVGK